MLKNIKIDLKEIEMMLYYWQSTMDKEKVSEQFLNDIASSKDLSLIYDDEFTAESVRKVLSAITNREPFKSNILKESRFWNNNMWVMEDFELTKMMIVPMKQLNLDVFLEKNMNTGKFEDIELLFLPLHVDTTYVIGNKLIINFFKIMIDFMDPEKITIEGIEFKKYIEDAILSMIS